MRQFSLISISKCDKNTSGGNSQSQCVIVTIMDSRTPEKGALCCLNVFFSRPIPPKNIGIILLPHYSSLWQRFNLDAAWHESLCLGNEFLIDILAVFTFKTQIYRLSWLSLFTLINTSPSLFHSMSFPHENHMWIIMVCLSSHQSWALVRQQDCPKTFNFYLLLAVLWKDKKPWSQMRLQWFPASSLSFIAVSF